MAKQITKEKLHVLITALDSVFMSDPKLETIRKSMLSQHKHELCKRFDLVVGENL